MMVPFRCHRRPLIDAPPSLGPPVALREMEGRDGAGVLGTPARVAAIISDIGIMLASHGILRSFGTEGV